jgi:O-antigen/teichoic acid export membrane protein
MRLRLSTRKTMSQKLQQALFARVVFVILLSSLSSNAFAYLDPSTGSMVVTALVGLFASIALALKTYWYKLKRLLRRSGKRTAGPDQDS